MRESEERETRLRALRQVNPWLADAIDRHDAERAAFEARPPIVMCGCADWLTCAHPYPALVHLYDRAAAD
jgi:hypothetical protein